MEKLTNKQLSDRLASVAERHNELVEENTELREALGNNMGWWFLFACVGLAVGIIGCYGTFWLTGNISAFRYDVPTAFSFDNLKELDAAVTERKADLRKLENRLRFWQADAICLLGSPATVTPTRIIAYEDGELVSDIQYTEIKIGGE